MKICNLYRHRYGTASIDKILPSVITKSIWDFFKAQILMRSNTISILSYKHIFDLKIENNYLVLNYYQESPGFEIRSKTNVIIDNLPIEQIIWIIDNGKSFIMMLPSDY
ncbi:DUF960 family protein [Bacillus sp. JJ1127]|uniref:DUF960 family protein n=1 Tax=Bacillus sp. JJ1127 TaxID=3122952 RepID=UPI002FFDE51B